MTKIERELRFLRLCVVVLAVFLGVILLSSLKGARRKADFEVINVERINIVEKDGKLRMVISNKERFPDGVMDGRTLPRKGGKSPGMLFYNDAGDENGGLIFGSSETKDGWEAGAALLFDQYKQDQTIGIMYQEQNGRRMAGLKVWDRPDQPLTEVYDRFEALEKMKEGLEKSEAKKELEKEVREGKFGAQRVFVGKRPDRSAAITLADTRGRTRFQVVVDSAGLSRLEFLNEDGSVSFSLPPKENQ